MQNTILIMLFTNTQRCSLERALMLLINAAQRRGRTPAAEVRNDGLECCVIY